MIKKAANKGAHPEAAMKTSNKRELSIPITRSSETEFLRSALAAKTRENLIKKNKTGGAALPCRRQTRQKKKKHYHSKVDMIERDISKRPVSPGILNILLSFQDAIIKYVVRHQPDHRHISAGQ